MENLKEILKEKTFSFWCRVAIRVMAWIVLMFYMIYRIILPLIDREPLHLDQNDGYVMIGSIGILLAVEAVKSAYEKWFAKKIN